MTAYGQPSDVHCIPIEDSRWLHEKALEAVYLDSIVNTQDRQISLLETSKTNLAGYYEGLLKLEKEKIELQKEISSDMVRLSDSWKDEMEYYQKRSKKFRRQRNLFGGGIIVVVVLALL